MQTVLRRLLALILVALFLIPSAMVPSASASAYNGRPKLVVIIIIDQFRGDYLERFRDQLSPNGFRLLMDRGAYFTDCYYNYADTETAPGHATLFTGAYPSGHGIMNNDIYDPTRKKTLASIYDDNFKIVGAEGVGASPHNLMASTIGDELKLATGGKSRVFSVSLKDRSAILPGGYSADGAYWIDKTSGLFVTSSYYRDALPAWAAQFNAQKRNEKYWNLDWKDSSGKVFRNTAPGQKDIDGSTMGFYDIVGRTPFANDYQFEFIRELVANEKLGTGSTTDILAISVSSYDILGHKVGPDSPQLAAMTVALDKQLAEFFGFLGRQFGLANVWIAMSSDHGIPPMPEVAAEMRIPGTRLDSSELKSQLNAQLNTKFLVEKRTFIRDIKWPHIYVADEAFPNMSTEEAERVVGQTLMALHPEFHGYYTKSQLRNGQVRNDDMGRKYQNSYSPLGGSWVMIVSQPFLVYWSEPKYKPTDAHGMPYSYDTHVPLMFFGFPFQAGTYRNTVEPTDMAVTLASLLGINKPTHAVGRVLIEALQVPRARAAEAETPRETQKPRENKQ